MRVCEICGMKEDVEKNDSEKIEAVILHICENCREERKWSYNENWAF